MKNTILAAATVLAVALSVGTGFAAERNNGNGATSNTGSSISNHCASILADREAYSKSDVHYCEAQ